MSRGRYDLRDFLDKDKVVLTCQVTDDVLR